jgi:hypothetical protein
VGDGYWGDGGSATGSTGTGSHWVAYKVVADRGYSIPRVEFLTGRKDSGSANGQWTSGSAEVRIYSNDASTDKPGSLLASGTFTITPPHAWQGADMNTEVGIAPLPDKAVHP